MAALGRMSVDSNLSLEAGIVFFRWIKSALAFSQKRTGRTLSSMEKQQ
jgi:hypothetical protein